MLGGVQDVQYNVRDMQRAVGFYRDVLGMRVLDANDWWISLEFFGSRIGLQWTGGAPVPAVLHDDRGARHGATLTLRSTDLDTDLAYLQRCGSQLLGRSDHPWGRLAAITDPDGNVLKLMQSPT
ncbi:MAG: VOC family protein [Burkholderiaceae bacterium]|jgi:catechol 2,3-dioxygenase-like lactoylglutathione lyase family enzyme|nr:VOC family protein [Burkholderiaceae bacterium]